MGIFSAFKEKDKAWAFSFSPVVVILVHLLLAYEQHAYHIRPVLITLLQIRFVISPARESKIQHFNLIEPFSLSRTKKDIISSGEGKPNQA